MNSLLTEARTLSRLGAPVCLAQVGGMMLGMVDIWMAGRLGPQAVAAVALGDLWVFGTLIVGMGVVMGIDPMVSQAHGAGKGKEVGLALQRGIVLAFWVSIPLTGLWLLTGSILRLAGQSVPLAAVAHQYALSQIFSIFPFLVFIALRQFLQGRGLMMPTLHVILVANLINGLLDWVLMFGKWGFPAMGVVGCGLATGLTRTFLPIGLLGLVWGMKLHREVWVPWTRSTFGYSEIRGVLKIGLPIGLQMGLEIWAFSLSSLFAGWLGSEALAAHTIVMKLASFTFMFPLGISIAAATRVGNLIGARESHQAQRAAWVALGLGGMMMAGFALLMVAGRHWFPGLFLGEPNQMVLAMAASILPVAATFQVFDGIQVVGGGILRGMGNTRPAAFFNLVGYYILGLPLALVLAFPHHFFVRETGMGLPGIWIGLALGLGVVALMLVFWIAARGPARARGLIP